MAKKIEKKVTGNIFGFSPNIYNTIPYWGQLKELWSSSITNYLVKDSKTFISFNWQGSQYVIDLKVFDDYKYQGRIICDGEEVGRIFLTGYSNNIGKLLMGDWVEDGKNYNVLIELNIS